MKTYDRITSVKFSQMMWKVLQKIALCRNGSVGSVIRYAVKELTYREYPEVLEMINQEKEKEVIE